MLLTRHLAVRRLVTSTFLQAVLVSVIVSRLYGILVEHRRVYARVLDENVHNGDTCRVIHLVPHALWAKSV